MSADDHNLETHVDKDQALAPLGVRHDAPRDNGPLSWRDVYTAVRDSEDRVVQAIGRAVSPVIEESRDHERRLRDLELHGSAEASEALTLGKANEKAIDRFLYREQGIFSTLGAGKTVILAVVACTGPILAVIALVTR